VDYSHRLPAFIIVGLTTAALQERPERVPTAIKNAGLNFPRRRMVVNPAPGSVCKEGPAYDLPNALGVMILAGSLPIVRSKIQLLSANLQYPGIPFRAQLCSHSLFAGNHDGRQDHHLPGA